MKRWTQWMVIGMVSGMALFFGTAQAQYPRRPGSAGEGRSSTKEDDFDRAVALGRFRTGNPEWDTQELIASGLAALHREHLEILKELSDLRKQVQELEER